MSHSDNPTIRFYNSARETSHMTELYQPWRSATSGLSKKEKFAIQSLSGQAKKIPIPTELELLLPEYNGKGKLVGLTYRGQYYPASSVHFRDWKHLVPAIRGTEEFKPKANPNYVLKQPSRGTSRVDDQTRALTTEEMKKLYFLLQNKEYTALMEFATDLRHMNVRDEFLDSVTDSAHAAEHSVVYGPEYVGDGELEYEESIVTAYTTRASEIHKHEARAEEENANGVLIPFTNIMEPVSLSKIVCAIHGADQDDRIVYRDAHVKPLKEGFESESSIARTNTNEFKIRTPDPFLCHTPISSFSKQVDFDLEETVTHPLAHPLESYGSFQGVPAASIQLVSKQPVAPSQPAQPLRPSQAMRQRKNLQHEDPTHSSSYPVLTLGLTTKAELNVASSLLQRALATGGNNKPGSAISSVSSAATADSHAPLLATRAHPLANVLTKAVRIPEWMTGTGPVDPTPLIRQAAFLKAAKSFFEDEDVARELILGEHDTFIVFFAETLHASDHSIRRTRAGNLAYNRNNRCFEEKKVNQQSWIMDLQPVVPELVLGALASIAKTECRSLYILEPSPSDFLTLLGALSALRNSKLARVHVVLGDGAEMLPLFHDPNFLDVDYQVKPLHALTPFAPVRKLRNLDFYINNKCGRAATALMSATQFIMPSGFVVTPGPTRDQPGSRVNITYCRHSAANCSCQEWLDFDRGFDVLFTDYGYNMMMHNLVANAFWNAHNFFVVVPKTPGRSGHLPADTNADTGPGLEYTVDRVQGYPITAFDNGMTTVNLYAVLTQERYRMSGFLPALRKRNFSGNMFEKMATSPLLKYYLAVYATDGVMLAVASDPILYHSQNYGEVKIMTYAQTLQVPALVQTDRKQAEAMMDRISFFVAQVTAKGETPDKIAAGLMRICAAEQKRNKIPGDDFPSMASLMNTATRLFEETQKVLKASSVAVSRF